MTPLKVISAIAIVGVLFGAMTGTDWASVIMALSGLVSAVLSGIAAIYSVWNKGQGAKTAADVADVKTEVAAIHLTTNSMQSALTKATGEAKFLEGEKQGRKTEEDRVSAEGQGQAPDPKDAVTINADVAEITVEKVVKKP